MKNLSDSTGVRMLTFPLISTARTLKFELDVLIAIRVVVGGGGVMINSLTLFWNWYDVCV